MEKVHFFILEDNIHYDIDFIGLNFNEFVYFPSDEYAGLLTGFKTDSNKEYDKQSYTHFKDILERWFRRLWYSNTNYRKFNWWRFEHFEN